MTPKEEAKELIDKFCNVQKDDISTFYLNIYEAKQCALIAVNVILSRCIDEEEQYRAYKYWEQVKQEIEKL
jgi:hypothetical protein